MNNQTRHNRVLELDKVLGMLAECAICPETAGLALDITPSMEYDDTMKLLSETAEAARLSVSHGFPPIAPIVNCDEQLKRAAVGGSMSLGELLRVKEILYTSKSMEGWYRQASGEHTSLSYLFDCLYSDREIEDRLSESILSEEELADSASPALMSIRRSIRQAGLNIRTKLDSMIKSPTIQKYLRDPIVTFRNGRFVVPVKAEYRNEIKGIVHGTSGSGITFFIEPISVVEANNEINVLTEKEREEVARIISELSEMVGEKSEQIIAGYHSIIDIDLVFCKARLGEKMHAIVPDLTDDEVTALKGARHPLIDRTEAVPIDISVGGEYDTLVITGPNTGGKTVAIKTLGLLVLMSMCGLMIPASDGTSVSAYRQVFADIGDEQSIEQSLSTFSSHMTNIIDIIDNAGIGTLILLDELGAGTDPVEGAALAVAIIEKLRRNGAKIAATTHYPEIKVYALDTKGVQNASCEFDVATLKPTYRLITGIPGRSNAFLISEKLGLKADVIDRAKEYISEENNRFEEVVSELNATRQNLEAEREKAAQTREELERIKRQAEENARLLLENTEKEINKTKERAKVLIEEIRVKGEIVFEELDDLRRKKDAENFSQMVTQARQQLRTVIKEMDGDTGLTYTQVTSDYELPRPLVKGDTVFVRSLNREGVVTGLPEKGKVQVTVGQIRTAVSLDEVILNENATKKNSPKKETRKKGGNISTKGVTSKSQRDVKMELDIRGMDSVSAVMELNAFIDSAVLSGVPVVRIIHGKGTGVLRQAVTARLKAHKNIATFRLGTFGEGESGVTVAELR